MFLNVDGESATGNRRKTIAVGFAVVLTLVVVGEGFGRILSSALCSKLKEQVDAASASALGSRPTAETILAAREAARARAQALGREPAKVEAALEHRIVQARSAVHLVIDVDAGDCHAIFERDLDPPPSAEEFAILAARGITERSTAALNEQDH